MNLLEIRAEIIKRVADYAAMRISHEQIAAAVGLEVAQVENLLKTPACIQQIAERQIAQAEKYQTIADGWDAVEEESVAAVLETVRNTPDPVFALQAAKTANAAQRRASLHQRGELNPVIDGNSTSIGTAVITLNQIYIEQVQSGEAARKINERAKRVDAMDVGSVQHLLNKPESKEIDELFKDVNFYSQGTLRA